MQSRSLHSLTPTPPLGWTSSACYGTMANKDVLLANLKEFEERLKPHGYQYFVLDGGWYRQYDMSLSESFPLPDQDYEVKIDTFGRPVPAPCFFPDGFRMLATAVHRAGLKFGLTLTRGIPRKAVEKNTPVKGADQRARDIAVPDEICPGNPDYCTVDMSRPGAQAYYDSVVERVAAWRADYLAYDGIVDSPADVEAAAAAVEKCDRDIVLTLGPGTGHHLNAMASYRRANVLRISGGKGDTRENIDHMFSQWNVFSTYAADNPPGFWFDQDVIPLGRLCVWNPRTPKREDILGEKMHLFERTSRLSDSQKRSLITMHALAASPLMIGGELRWTDYFGFYLLTQPGMLACNQNGVPGHIIVGDKLTCICKTQIQDDPGTGWFGIFNRHPEKTRKIDVDAQTLGLDPRTKLCDVWREKELGDLQQPLAATLDPDDVLFVYYTNT